MVITAAGMDTEDTQHPPPPTETRPIRWNRACIAVVRADGGACTTVRGDRIGGVTRWRTVAADEARREAASGTRVVAAVPLRSSVVRRIAAPFAGRRKALRVLPSIADVQLPFPIEECRYAFLDVCPTPEANVDALAVIARDADVRRELESLAAAGFDPVTLDSEALCLWTQSLREARPQARNEIRLVVHMEPGGFSLLVGSGRHLLGAHALHDRDPAAASRRVARYRKSDLPAEARWCFAGPEATETAARQFHETASGAWPGPMLLHAEPASFLGRALAMRELGGSDLPCNLRAGPLEHPARRMRLHRVSLRAAAAVLACGLVLAGVAVHAMRRTASAEMSARAEVARLVDRLAGYRVTARGEHAIAIARDAVQKRIALLRPFARQLADSPAAVLPDIAGAAKAQGIRIESLSLSPTRLVLAGSGPTWRSAEELAARLQTRLASVRLDRRDARADLRIPFTITAEVRSDP
jgi:hypothetical protein